MKTIYIVALVLLALLTIFSAVFNAAMILALVEAREIALVTVSDTREAVAGINEDVFAYTYHLEQEFPISVSVPFEDEFTVPVQTTIPVNTTIVVPIDLGITTYNMRVPINMAFPVDMEFTVPISKTIDFSTTVPVKLDFPIEIPIGETSMGSYLEEVGRTLELLEHKLLDPFVDIRALFSEYWMNLRGN